MLFHRDNHYVPRLYLKRFTASDGRIPTYRILVAHHRARDWNLSSTKGVAYHAYLYTRIASGVESDEIESWLKRDFEDPAEESINRATSDRRLEPSDWHRLIRFLAAQDVRTPARLMEVLQRARRDMPEMLQRTLENSVRELEATKQAGEVITAPKASNAEYLPFRVTPEIDRDKGFRVKAEVVVGRGYWLFTIRHLLTSSLDVLLRQRWSILAPPDGLTWFTSDDPVLKVNYYSDGKYDLNGGWGSKGTEIFLPLSPRHLLYTQVGQRPPARGSVVSNKQGQLFRGLIAEHAHRFIFAASPQSDVSVLRPRVVDAEVVRQEREGWLKWNQEQASAERELLGAVTSGASSI